MSRLGLHTTLRPQIPCHPPPSTPTTEFSLSHRGLGVSRNPKKPGIADNSALSARMWLAKKHNHGTPLLF